MLLDTFIELSQTVSGRAQLRSDLITSNPGPEAAEATLRQCMTADIWPPELLASGHHLLVAAVLAGGLRTPTPALESLWQQAERGIWRITGFGDRWVEALCESQGWPLFRSGLQQLFDWLQGTPREINLALDWLAGLRWHAAAPRVADTVGLHRLAGWRDPTEKCRKLLEVWACDVMSQVPARCHPPRLINHYIRSMLTGWGTIPPNSLFVRLKDDPRFIAATMRMLAKAPHQRHAICSLVLMGSPAVELTVVEALRNSTRDAYNHVNPDSGIFTQYLLERSPSAILPILDEKPWMVTTLVERWRQVRSALRKLSQEHQLHFRRLLKINGHFKQLADLGDQSIFLELKSLEKDARLKGNSYYDGLGALIYLCDQPDPEIRKALVWRLETGPEHIQTEAARLLAVLGAPEILWDRIRRRNPVDDPILEYRDLLALAVGGKSLPALFNEVVEYLSSVALGNPLAFLQSHQRLHGQCMALIGLFIMAPSDLVDRLRVVLARTAPSYVRLLAAEALEKLGALDSEKAVLPIFREMGRESWPAYLDILELYDLDTVRKIVCGLKVIVLPDCGPYHSMVHEFEKAGHGELLKHENRRTFDQPYFLMELLKLPATNPHYDQRILELKNANAYSLPWLIRVAWERYPHASLEMIELMAYLMTSGLYGWSSSDFVAFAHEHQVYDPRFIAEAKQHLDSANQRTYDTCVNYLNWCYQQEGLYSTFPG